MSAERNTGIDLLRSVSMFMIAALHVLGQGGVLDEAPLFSAQYECAWLLEIAAFSGVNCFALISGYVGYGKKIRYENILYLYLQVTFYTLLITLLFQIFGGRAVTWRDYLDALFSFAKGTYWYFSVYFAMFFFTPFFRILLEKISEREAKIFLTSVFVIFCILPIFMKDDMFGLASGYSVIWISVMYLVGGCIRKFGFGLNKRGGVHLRNFILLVLITWLSKFLIQMLHLKVTGVPGGGMHFISYISPTIFLASIELLLLFQKLPVRGFMKTCVAFFAPVAFDVYLIHEHPFMVSAFIEGKFKGLALMPILGTAGAVLLIAFLIWLAGSLLGRVRLLLFDLLQIKSLCGIVVEKTGRCIRRFLRLR